MGRWYWKWVGWWWRIRFIHQYHDQRGYSDPGLPGSYWWYWEHCLRYTRLWSTSTGWKNSMPKFKPGMPPIQWFWAASCWFERKSWVVNSMKNWYRLWLLKKKHTLLEIQFLMRILFQTALARQAGMRISIHSCFVLVTGFKVSPPFMQSILFTPFQVNQHQINAGKVANEVAVGAEAINGIKTSASFKTIVSLPQYPTIGIGETQTSLCRSAALASTNQAPGCTRPTGHMVEIGHTLYHDSSGSTIF